MKREILKKIMKKKSFSKLPELEVKKTFKKFEKKQVSEKEKIRLTRELLNRVFWPFRSYKLLEIKKNKIQNKSEEWFLRKHFSSRERLGFYKELYSRILQKGDFVFDLGAGANGFSYKFMPPNVKYVGIEAVGQLVDLMNFYFKLKKLNAEYLHKSLFDLKNIKDVIKKKLKTETNKKSRKVLFLFKVLDSLEMLERNYSKKFLEEICSLFDVVVVSFATRSMLKREKFKVNRKWIIKFIKEHFKITDDFELGEERYLVFIPLKKLKTL